MHKKDAGIQMLKLPGHTGPPTDEGDRLPGDWDTRILLINTTPFSITPERENPQTSTILVNDRYALFIHNFPIPLLVLRSYTKVTKISLFKSVIIFSTLFLHALFSLNWNKL